jgi:hypothetical protein
MSKVTALSISVGVFGLLSTLMTATIWPLPVWVLFLAWASFFFIGGGWTGLVKSVACNWTGILIATATLLSVHTMSGGIWLSVAVGVGSFAMVQASRLPWISAAPAIVFGFAMTVGTMAATGNPITAAGLSHPALVAAITALVGAGFGLASELGAAALSRGFGKLNTRAVQPA